MYRQLICRRPLLLCVACLCIIAATPAAAAKRQEPINILLFTADDLHAESVGSFAQRPTDLTPHLDRFAKQSLRFNRAHVNAAICAPSRAIIATGLYGHHSGAMGFMPAKPGTPEIVTTFQRAGYLAGILGKVGHSTPVASTKWDYQFDQKQLGNGRNPDIYYQRCATFFERCRKEGKPFYFMVNSHDPHRPYCNPKRLTKGAAMPSKVYKPAEVTVPGFLPDLPGVRAELAHYMNSTRRLDDTFGKVMKALLESGMGDRTLVVFLSDNGIAVPFAKCNAWFHSTRTPMLVRFPGVTRPGTVDDLHFVSGVDLFPTFLEATGVSGPKKLDGRSFLSLLKGDQTQSSRTRVFTQIDKKAGGDSVPMRCVQNRKFGYIYNPFSNGKHLYRNNNEGLCMRAMNEAAKTDEKIAARIQLFRFRVPEELYDLEQDPDCLRNLINDPAHAETLNQMRKQLQGWMKDTGDPMLPAFVNRDDRSIVDQVMLKTYGRRPQPKNRKKKRRKKKDA